MIRWLIRLAFPALGLLMVLIFFGINDPESMGSAPNASMPAEAAETMPSFEGLVPTPIPEDGPEIVFKWKDKEGSWHYADAPPAQGAWNALAVEPSAKKLSSPMPSSDPESDWQSPYTAPFSLSPEHRRNGT
ncbi:DUF4124 domain-containing protein [Marinobacter caseinilyticus]|uniref:DUF4124 domain-containing protein n=1 Tax=Marinobacter caseinilyticus TaxID=2692195 RepID=UPI0031F45C37